MRQRVQRSKFLDRKNTVKRRVFRFLKGGISALTHAAGFSTLLSSFGHVAQLVRAHP